MKRLIIGVIAGAALLGVLIAIPVAFAPPVIAAVRVGPDWAGPCGSSRNSPMADGQKSR